MEPIVTLTYVLSSFYGYYIGNDIYNNYIYRRDYNELKLFLERIEFYLNNIHSKL